ncbi:VCBS repeat-containing protein [Aurantibacter crassamenti]|uniref:FG-GAP repeat domain-containing protein n=1 Tax=Aurantibacter crassamenti TaxID=1837375 RepID=UPI0019393875|nr:VCBS repeat-containing protein [Aurantibacter crassamenti]MBM1105157.1 VCBS repeat-containing protein [Aurantibacter crassamenti]
MQIMRGFGYYFFLLFLLFSCGQKKEKISSDVLPITDLTGRELAEIHCASCHNFVPPAVLPKASWQFDVLPAMGNRLGIYNGKHQPDSIFGSPRNSLAVKKANIFPETPLLAKADWMKIVAYYLENSPVDILPPHRNITIKNSLKHFRYKEPLFADKPPLTTMVKILENKKGLVFSDSKRNKNQLIFLNSDLEKEQSLSLKNAPIHYYENEETVYLTTAGRNIFPNDLSDGSVQNLVFNKNSLNIEPPIISGLQRPVNMAFGDLNADGKEDIVACEYGDLTGKLVWYENKGSSTYQAHLLKSVPGAIKAIIKDYNKDGFNDIFVLMAQGNEGVFYFENTGKGDFKEKQLLSFSPLNGSQNIELVDFNNDGYEDIVYVCGDNADKTPILKPYHGIYIFLNDGHLNFEQSFFYHQNGAYKAISNDYDLDGDLDIAAISFFPDYLNSPEESFVYLENIGDLNFEASTFSDSSKGRWIVMDAGDLDTDGDIDLVLGSFVQFFAKGDTTGLSKRWLTESPSVIILENTIK